MTDPVVVYFLIKRQSQAQLSKERQRIFIHFSYQWKFVYEIYAFRGSGLLGKLYIIMSTASL